ncbi:hypothetical protein [Salinicola peritrichatus]|uniref:hypothetical protein n=1 Tax=Salinicola peritrichatus TaxID=1267424 RepID=UPI000DA1DC6F|nr:hypothetical protein [Salinicola peritrichatus]
MTINVALATSEAIVLGCDSLSSMTEPVFRAKDVQLVTDEHGSPILDQHGNLTFRGQASHAVTTVFGGVRKMFCISEGSIQVAAVTAGLAILDGMTIAEHANKFRRETGSKLGTVEEVASAFLAYVRDKWELTVGYTETADDESYPQLYDNVEFLVAGFEPKGEGRVYRIDVLAKSMQLQYDGRPGIAWAGQANYVQRLLIGADESLQFDLVERHGLPTKSLEAVLSNSRANIDFANLPTQYAIDFVEMVVNTQSGMQRFEPGIATVGGRTHIGVLRRGEKFAMLNEPELIHKHTGFNHDD